MKKFTKISAIVLAGIMVLGSVACASTTAKSSDRNYAIENNYKAGQRAVSESINGVVGSDYDYEAVADEAESMSPAGSHDGQNTTNPDLTSGVPTNAMLIRKVNMNVETTEFNNVKKAVEAKMIELGGYIESSNVSGTGKNGNLHFATLVIRVPVEKLDEMINMVGNTATILSSNETAEDVTLQYSDIQAKIKSLKVEQDTLLGLLAQADSLDSIIVLQNRLSEVRYEIESYESRGKVLANQSAYSTLTLTINEVMEVTEQVETKKPSFGDEIWEKLEGSLETLKEGGKDFVIGFVGALPFLLVIGIIGLITFLIVMGCVKGGRRRRAKRAAKAVPAVNAAPVVPEVKEVAEAQEADAEKAAEEPVEEEPASEEPEDKKGEDKK